MEAVGAAPTAEEPKARGIELVRARVGIRGEGPVEELQVFTGGGTAAIEELEAGTVLGRECGGRAGKQVLPEGISDAA